MCLLIGDSENVDLALSDRCGEREISGSEDLDTMGPVIHPKVICNERNIVGEHSDADWQDSPTSKVSEDELSRLDSGHFEGSSYFTSCSQSSTENGPDSSRKTAGLDITDEFPEVFGEDQSPKLLSGVKAEERSSTSRAEQVKSVVDLQSTLIYCENPLCGKRRTLDVARHYFKNCHNCSHAYYCSRTCRRQDWTRHKNTVCHGSRVNSACKDVIRMCNSDTEIRDTLSRLARRGYLTSGRGCVLLGLPDLASAQDFIDFGLAALELNPVYVTLKELSQSKMYGDVLEMLQGLCRLYDPATRFVLNVGVGARWNRTSQKLDTTNNYGTIDSGFGSLPRKNSPKSRTRSGSFGSDGGYGSLNTSFVNLSPQSLSKSLNGFIYQDFSGSILRNKGPVIQKCIRLKLAPPHVPSSLSNLTFEERQERQNATRYGRTLIVTGISGSRRNQRDRRTRELCFINVQRQLRQRGVSLRHQFPLIYADLVRYVTDGVHFPSQIIYPVDTKAKKLFMCALMPEAESGTEWARSAHLLDQLDISKDSIYKSLSRSRSLSSSLHNLAHPLSVQSVYDQLEKECLGMWKSETEELKSNTVEMSNSELKVQSEDNVSSHSEYHSKDNLYINNSQQKCPSSNVSKSEMVRHGYLDQASISSPPIPSLRHEPTVSASQNLLSLGHPLADTSLEHFTQGLNHEPYAVSSPKVPKTRSRTLHHKEPAQFVYENVCITSPHSDSASYPGMNAGRIQTKEQISPDSLKYSKRERRKHPASSDTKRKFNTNHPSFQKALESEFDKVQKRDFKNRVNKSRNHVGSSRSTPPSIFISDFSQLENQLSNYASPPTNPLKDLWPPSKDYVNKIIQQWKQFAHTDTKNITNTIYDHSNSGRDISQLIDGASKKNGYCHDLRPKETTLSMFMDALKDAPKQRNVSSDW